MTQLNSYSDKIRCKICGWSGEVRLCLEDRENNYEDDSPLYLCCPSCFVIVVVEGEDFRTVDENAICVKPIRI